jgi:pimeloyl-ACP methyl ester carboxylesterase
MDGWKYLVMLENIGTRELLTLDGLGVRIRGTYHRTSHHSLAMRRMSMRECPGVLFLNSLSLPRAATGDSAVHWAESCAERGYPSFRFDLPGLGDSDGDLSTDLLDFINSGGYAHITAAKIEELVERIGLSGVVIVGHCAGAVSALFAAAASKRCRGLIMMDPYFHFSQMIRPKVRHKLSDWARRSRLGGFASDFYDRCRGYLLARSEGRPPRNANFRLLSCWKQTATMGMPILILKAPGLKASGIKPRVGQFDYIKYAMEMAGNENQVTVKLIEGTDHSFANGVGRSSVDREITNWLERYFPAEDLATQDHDVVSASTQFDRPSNDRKLQKVPADAGCAMEGHKPGYGRQNGSSRTIQARRP